MLEPEAARQAATNATADQVAVLTAAYDGMARNAPALPDSDDAFVAADLEFHLTLLRASGNQLVEQLGRLLETGLHHALEVNSHLPGGVAATLPLHKAVLAAVRNRKPNAANRAMRALLEKTVEAMHGSFSR
jgi:DNA-binding FadR family transcriptional regulator